MTEIIKKNCILIGKFISEKASLEDPASVMERLNEASALLGTASYDVAECERIYNIKLGELAEQYSEYSPTTAKNIITGKLSEEIYYKTLAESQDKQLHYVIESLRTMISFLKNEMNAIK